MSDALHEDLHDDRRPITLGVSLKLHLDIDDSVAWAASLAATARAHPAVIGGGIRLFVLPSHPALGLVAEALGDAPVALGAQDLFWHDRGAYTGAVSGADLVRLGCRYVEVGHSERRTVFGEGDDVIRRKFAAAVRNGLTPVLCVGEEHQKDADSAAAFCAAQFDSAVAGIDGVCEIVVAYEPEWAIGKSSPASAGHVTAVVERLKAHLESRGFDDAPVIYGGSAKPGLLSTLGPAVDGLFLGRFAHDPETFTRIVDEAATLWEYPGSPPW